MNLSATSASIGTHVAIGLALMLAANRHLDDGSQRHRVASGPLRIVHLLEAGDTGGGKLGGGNRNPAPPPSAQNLGSRRIVLSPRSAIDPTPPQMLPSSDLEERVDVPALPRQTGLEVVPGAITAIVTPETDSRGPGEGPAVGPGRGRGPGEGEDGLGLGRRGPGGDADGGGGIDPPVVIRQVKPAYTTAALQARIQGVVLMEALVLPDGSVGDVRIVRSLDRHTGLDEEAIKAVRQWRFRPGTRLGRPVPVIVSVELTFTLR